MQFSELNYPDAPIPRRELLWENEVEGYSCLIYNCPDTPHLIARINGRDFAVRVGSIFTTIIKTVEIPPNASYNGNGAEEREQDGPSDD